MYLRDIDFSISDKQNPYYLSFNRLNHIPDLFLKCLSRKYFTGDFSKIIIDLTFDPVDGNQIQKLLNVLVVKKVFNFSEYESLPVNFQEKYFLDFIFHSISNLALDMGWQTDPLLDAYNCCLKKNLINEWMYKNKLFRSPDRNYYAAFLHSYNSVGFNIHIVLYNKMKQELNKYLIYKAKYDGFPLDWVKWSEETDSISFKFKPPNKIFNVPLSKILSDIPMNIPESESQYFKNNW